MKTDPFVDAAIRGEIDRLILDGHLSPPQHAAMQRLQAKARVLPHADNLTAAELAWVAMLGAKRAALVVAGVLP